MKSFKSLLLLSMFTVSTFAIMKVMAQDGNPSMPAPPVTEKKPKTTDINGDHLVDNYFWLREKTNPAVIAHLEAENAYTAAAMKPTEALQEKLYNEILSHIKQDDTNVPYRQGGYFYFSKTKTGLQYPIFYRKQGSLDAPEELILDQNELAKGQKFMSLGTLSPSDDGNLLAYSTDNTGYRQYTLQVKDLRTGQLLPERIEKVTSAAWAADNKTLFYTVEDSAKRPYRLYRHRLGSPGADDLLYEAKDEMFTIRVTRTRSRAYLLLHSGSHTTSEVRYLPAALPDDAWKIIAPREHEHEYDVDHHGELFYIRTNSGGRNFRLVSAPAADPRRESWKEVIPHRPSLMLEAMAFFAPHYVLPEREDGLPRWRATDVRNSQSHRIEFPEPAY